MTTANVPGADETGAENGDIRPEISLLCDRAHTGKTQWAIERILHKTAGRALLVVPTARESEQIRQTILGAARENMNEAAAACTFADLIADIQSESNTASVKQIIPDFVQQILLGRIVAESAEPGSLTGESVAGPRPIKELQIRLQEWISEGVTAKTLAALTAQRLDRTEFGQPSGERIRYLQTILQRFENLLDTYDLTTPELAEWRASEILCARPEVVNAKTIVFDGFNRFTGSQLAVVRALALNRKSNVSVTLCWDPERPSLFEATAETRDILRSGFRVSELPPLTYSNRASGSLAVLERNLFSPRTPADIHDNSEAVSGMDQSADSDSIHIISAPDVYSECELAARYVRDMHFKHGVPWFQCGVIVRSRTQYSEPVKCVFERFSIPVQVEERMFLSSNPMLQTLMRLLHMYVHDWTRQDVTSLLKSPYLSDDRSKPDALRVFASELGVRNGKREWMRLASKLPAQLQSVADTLTLLARLQDRVTATGIGLKDRLERVLELASALDMHRQSARLGVHFEQRDNDAMRVVTAQFKGLCDLMSVLGDAYASFEQVVELISLLFREVSYPVKQDFDAVKLLEPPFLHRRPILAAVVMGLNEGRFPLRNAKDPFLRDEDRSQLNQLLNARLQLSGCHMSAEKLFFYAAVSAPTTSLALTYPRTDSDEEALASGFIEEVREACANAAPIVTISVSISDLLEGSFNKSNDPDYSTGDQTVNPVTARKYLAAPDRCFSVSEIELYRTCPFRYLTEVRLGLDTSTGIKYNRLRLTLFLEAMNVIENRVREDGFLEPGPKQISNAFSECLNRVSPDLLDYQVYLLCKQVFRDLVAHRTGKVSGATGYTTATKHFNLSFGRQGETGARGMRSYGITNSVGSIKLPLLLDTANNQAVCLSDMMDRVDIDRSEKATVYSYTLANPLAFGDMVRAESLREPLQMLAMEQLFGKTTVAVCSLAVSSNLRVRAVRSQFASVEEQTAGSKDSSGSIRILSREQYRDMLNLSKVAVIGVVRGLGAGDVRPAPGEHCRTCNSGKVCRSSLNRGFDVEHDIK